MTTSLKTLFLAVASAAILPASGQTFTFFSDDFESALPPGANGDDPLLGNGMVVGANVFDASDVYVYGYFSFPAPNVTGDGARFCNIASGEGGLDQGAQQLAVFSDYNNGPDGPGGPGSMTGAHAVGDLVDANTFVEYFLDADDLGTTVTFVFDAKYGDLDLTPLTGVPAGSAAPFTPEAEAFVKVLDPLADFSTVLSDVEDASLFPITWGTYTLTIMIPNDPAWDGRLLQAGFRSKTSLYQASAIFYDNISLTSDKVVTLPAPPQVTSIVKDPSNPQFVDIFYHSEVGKTYTLLKALNPGGMFSEAVGSNTILDGDGLEQFLTDDEGFEASAYYRLREEPTP